MDRSSTESAEDAISEEEMATPAKIHAEGAKGGLQAPKSNAFTELMSRKSMPVASKPMKTAHRVIAGRDRDGLSAYTKDPESFPPSVIVHHDASWVVIHDMFPKASIHLLLLPRDPQISGQHPFDALSNLDFLASTKVEATKWRHFAASELRRLFGAYSASDTVRRAAMDADEPPVDATSLPVGRDWAREVRVGVHAHPSMNHLHIHVISVDMQSERMKHRKHYNSFKTAFFVDLDDFPLAEDDVRRHPGREGYLGEDLKCWRCGKNFGNGFARLKEHLAEEYEEWKKE